MSTSPESAQTNPFFYALATVRKKTRTGARRTYDMSLHQTAICHKTTWPATKSQLTICSDSDPLESTIKRLIYGRPLTTEFKFIQTKKKRESRCDGATKHYGREGRGTACRTPSSSSCDRRFESG